MKYLISCFYIPTLIQFPFLYFYGITVNDTILCNTFVKLHFQFITALLLINLIKNTNWIGHDFYVITYKLIFFHQNNSFDSKFRHTCIFYLLFEILYVNNVYIGNMFAVNVSFLRVFIKHIGVFRVYLHKNIYEPHIFDSRNSSKVFSNFNHFFIYLFLKTLSTLFSLKS